MRGDGLEDGEQLLDADGNPIEAGEPGLEPGAPLNGALPGEGVGQLPEGGLIVPGGEMVGGPVPGAGNMGGMPMPGMELPGGPAPGMDMGMPMPGVDPGMMGMGGMPKVCHGMPGVDPGMMGMGGMPLPEWNCLVALSQAWIWVCQHARC